MLKLPKALRIGYRDYAVEPMPATEGAARGLLGECLNDPGIIRVREELSDQERAHILLHETLHAAWYLGSLPDAKEEHTITVLARQLVSIFASNPQLLEFMSQSLSPAKAGR